MVCWQSVPRVTWQKWILRTPVKISTQYNRSDNDSNLQIKDINTYQLGQWQARLADPVQVSIQQSTATLGHV